MENLEKMEQMEQTDMQDENVDLNVLLDDIENMIYDEGINYQDVGVEVPNNQPNLAEIVEQLMILQNEVERLKDENNNLRNIINDLTIELNTLRNISQSDYNGINVKIEAALSGDEEAKKEVEKFIKDITNKLGLNKVLEDNELPVIETKAPETKQASIPKEYYLRL